MLPSKLTFLFGQNLPARANLDDPDVVATYLLEAVPADRPDARLHRVLHEVIARQILDDDPSMVWETAQRLLALGIDRNAVLGQLTLALLPTIESALDPDDEPDEDDWIADGWIADERMMHEDESYETLLRQLPLPSPQDIEDTVTSILADGHRPDMDDLEMQLLKELGITDLSSNVERMLDAVMEHLLEEAEIALLPDDIVIVPAQLCRDVVLTTRLKSTSAWPPLDSDFAGFYYFADPFADPPSNAPPGQLLVARRREGRIVAEPAPEVHISEAEIAEIWRAYEAESTADRLPVPFCDLLLNMLAKDGSAFDEPRAPLSELVTAAGLQIRGELIASDTSVWRAGARVRKLARIAERATEPGQRMAVVEVLTVFEATVANAASVTNAMLRRALDVMDDLPVLAILEDHFFGDEDDPADIEATDVFARRLTRAASRPGPRAIAAWLTAMVAERRGDPLAAAEALAESVRHDPDFVPAIDHLAWTRSDQGRADDAKALWRRLGPDYPDLIAIEEATATAAKPARTGLRRNEPCWCGSGRKYKACHLRATDFPALPDRFSWLLEKPVDYLARRGDLVKDIIAETTLKLAGFQEENVDDVLEDPLVLDIVLHELGWFARFLADRGPLLPDDERVLFASWQRVSRTLYEITDVRPSESVTLRDLRTGEVVAVHERTLSRQAGVGLVICARALPDGRSHQFGGAVFTVPPGQEQMLVDILDDPDPKSRADRLLTYRAATRPQSPATIPLDDARVPRGSVSQ